MSIKLTIPTALRKITRDADVVAAEPGTVQEIIASLDQSYPGFRTRICEDAAPAPSEFVAGHAQEDENASPTDCGGGRPSCRGKTAPLQVRSGG